MKIGIYGGSFNPIHNGHLMLANFAKHELGLDKIIFVPSNITPNKKTVNIDSSFRVNMIWLAINERVVELAFADGISCVETNRRGVSYTIDTVKELKEHYPDDELFLICGSDVKHSIHTWKDYHELKTLINIKIQDVDFWAPAMQVRSTQVRMLLNHNKPISYLVPKSVEKFIDQHKLYQGENN